MYRTAAFEGGALRLLSGDDGGREVVLALPLNRLIVRLLRVPSEQDVLEAAKPVLQAMSPFPDEPLTIGIEEIRSDERERVVLAAAFPESSAEDVGAALDAAKLHVVRIDALALGQLRGLWNALDVASGGRRLVLMATADCVSVVVLDGELPCAIRAIDAAGDLKRELMLTLLEAEGFNGPQPLKEIVVTGELDAAGLETFAPVRRVEVGEDAALVGVAARTTEAGSLNALPESWQAELDETRFKAKLVRNVAIAGGFWLLLLGVLFGVPMVFGFMTDYQKGLSKDHRREYQQVKDMRDKTELVSKYSDHARGALEIMKALSDRLPGGITLTTWDYKREEGVSVAGEAENAEEVYKFKDAMDAMSDGDTPDEGEKIFQLVELSGPSASKNGQKFSLNCGYKTEESE